MTWIKVDANRHTHSRARELGGWGNIVLEAVWEIVKVHGRKGEVTLHAVTPEAICEWLRLDREEGGPWVDYMALGLERCFQSGALVNLDGKAKVRDWYQHQEDKTNTERQARFRERKENNEDNALRNGITGNNGNNDDMTGQDKTYKKEEGDYALTPSEKTNGKTSKGNGDAIGWDPSGRLILSEIKLSKLIEKYKKQGKDLNAEIPKFEKWHLAHKTVIKKPGGALATWMKRAKPSIPLDPLAEKVLKLYYRAWQECHDVPVSPNGADGKQATKIAVYLRQFEQPMEEVFEVFTNALELFLSRPCKESHPIGFLASRIDAHMSKVNKA